jgi:hypothetical protein
MVMMWDSTEDYKQILEQASRGLLSRKDHRQRKSVPCPAHGGMDFDLYCFPDVAHGF